MRLIRRPACTRRKYRAGRVTRALHGLLHDPGYRERAEARAAKV